MVERKQAETELVFEGAPLSSYVAGSMRQSIADTLNQIVCEPDFLDEENRFVVWCSAAQYLE
jgi:hypothetical protein